MPFVHRDADGNVLAVYNQPVDGGEEVNTDDPDLIAFIKQNLPDQPLEEWVQSDLGLARVLEDLIELLIEKKLLMFTDFPAGAQQKLLDRRGFRKEFDYVEDLFGTNESGFDNDDPDALL